MERFQTGIPYRHIHKLEGAVVWRAVGIYADKKWTATGEAGGEIACCCHLGHGRSGSV